MGRLLAKDQMIRPFFAPFWILGPPPKDTKPVKSYDVGESRVSIFHMPESYEHLYWLSPPSFELPDHELALLSDAIDGIWSSVPQNLDLGNQVQIRLHVKHQAQNLLMAGLPRTMGKVERESRAQVLATILERNAAGLGIIETLLADTNVQDVYIDAPCDRTPIHLAVADAGAGRLHQRCITNILMDHDGLKNLVSKLLLSSGKPFSERNPVLEIDLSEMNARLTAIRPPLSPEGVAIALRRHSTNPWTLAKLVHHRSLTPLAAGLLSFLIEGNSTLLVTGSRGAGKSSLLGAMMFEFPACQRVLVIEDTLELPCRELQRLGFKVQSLHVQSAEGMTAEDALRVSLRLGESAIVLGEVRGKEARTLYEAMRVGTAGSSVLGTIHGSSSQSVFERVVHDLGIPPPSFSATDVVIVAGLLRPRGSHNPRRRVVEISELCKDTCDGRFAPLMKYSITQDSLVETDTFQSGSSKIRDIANSWGLGYKEALSNIRIRAKVKSHIVDAARRLGTRLLSTKLIAQSNATFTSLLEEGYSDDDVLDRWKNWFDTRAEYA